MVMGARRQGAVQGSSCFCVDEVSPIADYDLGKARGRIVIDFDDRGTSDAQEQFQQVEEAANSLMGVFEKLRGAIGNLSHDFAGHAKRFAGAFGLMAGGSAILLGLSRATGLFTGNVFKMRGVLGILGSLGLLLGGVPKSIEGFPKVIKQIVLLSAAIGLFAKSTKLLDGVVRSLGKFIGSTRIIQNLTNAFPGLIGMLGKVTKFIPSIATVGKTIDGWGKPIHKIASMALLIGGLISVFKNGTKAALALTKGVLALGAGAVVIQGLIFLVGGLIDAAHELSGVLGLIPGLMVTAGIAGAALKIGFNGISDAMKKLGADQKEFDEAIKDLAPAAQNTMRALRGFKDAWADLQRNVQENLFAGMADQVRALGNIYIPLLKKGLGQVAAEFNNVGKEISTFLQRGQTVSDVNKLFGLTAQIIRNLTPAIQPLLQAFLDIATVSTEVLADLTQDAAGAAQSFASFIREARETGKLRQWIEDGITGMARLIDIIWTLGKIVKTVFDAFDDSGDGFLLTVNKMLDSWLTFLESAKGQEILHALVDTIQTLSSVTKNVLAAALSELAPILISILPFLKEMASTISGVLVTAIKILGPILKAVADVLSFLAPVLSPIIGFFLAWSIIMGALSLGIGWAVTVIGTLITAIGSIIKIVRILTAVLVANPIIAIITAIALIAWLIIENWEVIGPKLKAIWEWIASVATKVWNAIADFFVGVWESVRDFFVGIWNWIADTATDIWTSIADFFVGIWDAVSGAFEDAWDAISDFLIGIWNWIVDKFRPIWEPLVSIVKSIFSIIRDIIIIIVTAIAIVVIAIWETLRDAAVETWNQLMSTLSTIWNAILTAFHFIWDPLSDFFVWLWGIITVATATAWNAIMDFFNMIWEGFLAGFHAVWDPLVDFFTWLWDTISTGITNAWNAIASWFSQRFTDIGNFFRDVWNGIANFFSDIWNSRIVTAVRDGVNNVVDWIRSLPGKIWDLVKNAGQWLWEAGKAVITGFLNGLKSAFAAVADWVGGIKDWIVSHKGPVEKDKLILIPAGQAIMQGFLNGLQSKEQVIQRFLESFATDIERGIGGIQSAMDGTSANLNASSTLGIVSSLPSNAEALASAVTPVQVGANGVGDAPDAGGARTIVVQRLELHVAGNLDPTKPVEWRNAMKSIQDGIRSVERENK